MRELIEKVLEANGCYIGKCNCNTCGWKGEEMITKITDAIEDAYNAKIKEIDAEIEKINCETKLDLAGLVERSVIKGMERAKEILKGNNND